MKLALVVLAILLVVPAFATPQRGDLRNVASGRPAPQNRLFVSAVIDKLIANYTARMVTLLSCA